MPDLLRTFAVRNPAVLTSRQIDQFGIPSHPARYQSGQYKQWLALCKTSSREALRQEFIAYLRGEEAVGKLDDLGNAWASVVQAFLAAGPDIDKRAAKELLGRTKPDTLLGRDGKALFAVRTRVADTLLALANLRQLGHTSNLDYQAVIRILTFTERALAMELAIPELSIKVHFERPILLPSCFVHVDPCKRTSENGPFSFLPDLEGNPVARARPNKGCVDGGDCTCKVNDQCIEQRSCCAVIWPYVVDLMIVRESTKCYQAGDLSFIKNVLAGETFSTKHRRLVRTEEVTETEEETSRYSERDLQIDDKSALHKEISDTVSTDLSFDAGVTANASWGKGTYSLGTTANFAYDKSKETSNKEIRDYSRDVLDRSITKLEEKVRTAAKTTILIETKETNKHDFDNKGGANVSGQYLYVNKISRAQVFGYGKKAVIDIYLPEPASLFKKLLQGKFDGIAPTAPTPLNLTYDQITPENYAALALQFGLTDVPAPPAFQTSVEVVLEGIPGDPPGKNKKSGSWEQGFPVVIPPDYIGVKMSLTIVRLNYNEGGGVSISATLGPGGNNVSNIYNGQTVASSPLPSIEGNHEVRVHAWDVTEFTWILAITCDLKPEAKATWQMEIFGKIQQVFDKKTDQYQKALDKYLEAKRAFEDKEAALKLERYNRNPFINRETERTELKRMAISYISCQFFDQFDAMKNRVKPCGYPEMDIQDAEEEGRFIQFFEQAFNWNLLTYIFYPYFWGRKCTWPDKLKEESNDLIFRQFLAAGSARVLVPIRDGFYDHVQYFLATGEIWGSNGTPPVPGDPHFVSVAQEIKEQKGNYYADREGTINVTNGNSVVTLNDTDWYWTYADPLATPPIPAGVNTLNVDADRDREIIIDCKVYRRRHPREHYSRRAYVVVGHSRARLRGHHGNETEVVNRCRFCWRTMGVCHANDPDVSERRVGVSSVLSTEGVQGGRMSYLPFAQVTPGYRAFSTPRRTATGPTVSTEVGVTVPSVGVATSEKDKKSIPKSIYALIVQGNEVDPWGLQPSMPMRLLNWRQVDIEQYGANAVGSARTIQSIAALVLHETAAWNWVPLTGGKSIHFHVELDGIIEQHNDVVTLCNHARGDYNPITIGVEHVGFPWRAGNETSPEDSGTWVDSNLKPGGSGASTMLRIPPSKELDSSASLVKLLLLGTVGLVNLERFWPQVMRGELVDGKPRFVGDASTGSRYFYVPYIPGTSDLCIDLLGKVAGEGILSHGAIRRYKGASGNAGKTDGMAFPLYSWLVLHQGYIPQQARARLEQIFQNNAFQGKYHEDHVDIEFPVFDTMERAQ